MVIVSTTPGDVTHAPVFMQQVNAVTRKPHGLSAAVAARRPWADVYRLRGGRTPNTAMADERPTPGSVIVSVDPGDPTRRVYHLVGQWAPGKPGAWASRYGSDPSGRPETAMLRLEWFKECVAELDRLVPPGEVVAAPWRIGCGLAGGDWSRYQEVLAGARTRIQLVHHV